MICPPADKRDSRRRRGARRCAALALLASLAALFASSRVCAAPTQEDVFKSIQSNVNDPGGGAGALPFLLVGAAVVILLVLFTQRHNRAHSPRPANHQGKLLKEVLKTVPLRSNEVKQLKLLVEVSREVRDLRESREVREAKEEPGPSNPLTLVLCPSLLAKSMRKPPLKADRKVLAQLAKRTGAAIEPVQPLRR